MAHHKFIVFTKAKPGREDEFESWYDNIHIPEVMQAPGMLSAQRFRLSHLSGAPDWSYVVLYDVETDDLAGFKERLLARPGTLKLTLTDTLDPSVGMMF